MDTEKIIDKKGTWEFGQTTNAKGTNRHTEQDVRFQLINITRRPEHYNASHYVSVCISRTRQFLWCTASTVNAMHHVLGL